MSHYSTPFCSDEELLKELNKLGYDEVSPEVFERMKDDLSDLVTKEQDNRSNNVENEHDLPLSEYGYDDESPQSSKYLPAVSDDLGEWCTTQENYRKADSRASRKTKRKSQKSNLRHLNNQGDQISGLEYNRFQNSDNELEVRSSHGSLERRSVNDADVLPDFGNSQDRRAKVNKSKSTDSYVTRNSNKNRSEDKRYSNISKKNSPKENEFELNYSLKEDGLESGVSVAKVKNKATKQNKSVKSWEKIQEMSDFESSLNDNTLKDVNEAFKVFNLDEDYSETNASPLNNYKCSDINLNTSDTTSSEKKTIKRKVLRRRNGRSVITEELVEIPSFYIPSIDSTTTYPDSENLNSSKSFSSDDLSYKSNSSTGSVTVLSPESSIKSSPSTFSLSSRSTSLRLSNTRKKKNDPVAMYNYYKKFWDNFKPPGENTHDRLRWAVRDKMLEYHI